MILVVHSDVVAIEHRGHDPLRESKKLEQLMLQMCVADEPADDLRTLVIGQLKIVFPAP
jgi:hypothetical protein